MELFTTGQLFLAGGLAGVLVTAIAAVVVNRRMNRMEKTIRERIWREYR